MLPSAGSGHQQFAGPYGPPGGGAGGGYGPKRLFPSPPAVTDSVGTREGKDTNIKLTLENRELWHKFSAIGPEMIITKCGR